jgi:hypothetical protein
MPSRSQKLLRNRQALDDREKARMLQAQARLEEDAETREEKQHWELEWNAYLHRERLKRRAERERISKIRASTRITSGEEHLTKRQQRELVRSQLRMRTQWRLNKVARAKFLNQNQLLYDVRQRMEARIGERYMTWAEDPMKLATQELEDLSWEDYDSEHAEEQWELCYDQAAEERLDLREALQRAASPPAPLLIPRSFEPE